MYIISFHYIQRSLHNPCNACHQKIIPNNVADCLSRLFVNYYKMFHCLFNMKSETSLQLPSCGSSAKRKDDVILVHVNKLLIVVTAAVFLCVTLYVQL